MNELSGCSISTVDLSQCCAWLRSSLGMCGIGTAGSTESGSYISGGLVPDNETSRFARIVKLATPENPRDVKAIIELVLMVAAFLKLSSAVDSAIQPTPVAVPPAVQVILEDISDSLRQSHDDKPQEESETKRHPESLDQ